MEKSKNNSSVNVDHLLDTKELVGALPDVPKEQRPKYVQKLHETKMSVSIGGSSSADSSISAKPKNNNNYKRAPLPDGKRAFVRPFLKRQEVVELPTDVPTHDYLVSADNVIFFSGPSHYLSALYPVSVNVDGNDYNSVEHYYQACKLYTLVGKDIAAELKTKATPIEVKKATKSLLKGKVSPKLVSEWKNKDSIAILKHAITQKFLQNEELKKALLGTGDKLLVQTYIGDNFFAAGANVKYASGWVARHLNQSLKIPQEVSAENFKYLPIVANGKNALGWILMGVRRELRAN